MNYSIKAMAEGIIDAGCSHYANYPGFHSNELHSALDCKVTSSDEKNAFAFAWGCSMAGKRAAVSFKNVGLNDAADAFLGALFVGCRAGLVLILFDDCDIQHSQSRIEIRPYFQIYGGLWLEPRNVAELYSLTKSAFLWSERFGLPVVIRITNILYEQGLREVSWKRSVLPPSQFPALERFEDSSPYVVHPSEAWRMERELKLKNEKIQDFVEELYEWEDEQLPKEVVFGAKREIMVKNPLRLFTLPLPQKLIRRLFPLDALDNVMVYEHGASDFVKKQMEQILSPIKLSGRIMSPPAMIKSKYHNNSYIEKLFSVLRNVSDSIICGDLGGYTMDPHRTLQLCLAYGVSPAVSMGVAEAIPQKKVFCVTGDAAYLHSGQQCLYEMLERKVNLTVFVLDNGGALGTGGQAIPGNLQVHPDGVSFYELDYLDTMPNEMEDFVNKLPENGVNLVIVHTYEQQIADNSH